MCARTRSRRIEIYIYTVCVDCKQNAPVQIHFVYVLYNITLRFVCSLSGFCLVGSVDDLGAAQCGGTRGRHGLWTGLAV